MKILFVTARFPFPPFKGDQAIPYYRLKYLSKDHEITLLTFYQSDEELKHLDQISRYCNEIITVKISRLKSVLNMVLKGLFSHLPFQVLYFQSKLLEQKLKQVINENNFDLIHLYMLRIAQYGLAVKKPKVLELIDSMQLNFQRRANAEKWPLKFLFNMELKRLKHFETTMVKNYDRAIVVSDQDREYIRLPNVKTINLGIDTDYFLPDTLPQEPVLAFTGNMGYFPNRNAILWFLDNCWETIQATVPNAKLILAGKNPGAGLRRFDNGTSVQVLGFVDSMPKIINQARVAIAPMQAGSGMQFKILEAMACGRPVVTTNLGLGTIPARHNVNILLADSSQDFTESCITLLTQDSLAKSIGEKGMELVRNQFDWRHNVEKLQDLYNCMENIHKN